MVGVDFSEDAVRLCNENYDVNGLSFKTGNAESLPFRNSSYDVVVNVESSHCYSSMDAFLAQVQRVLREGGYFLYADFRRKEDVENLRKSLTNSGGDSSITSSNAAVIFIQNGRNCFTNFNRINFDGYW